MRVWGRRFFNCLRRVHTYAHSFYSPLMSCVVPSSTLCLFHFFILFSCVFFLHTQLCLFLFLLPPYASFIFSSYFHAFPSIHRMDEGHFTCIVRSKAENEWLLFNDAKISKCSADDVAASQKEAYLLFYEREPS